MAELNSPVAGVGLDLASVARFDRAVLRQPRLLRRLFTDSERARLAQGSGCAGPSAAQLFALKEAVMKALGQGMAILSFTDIESTADTIGGVGVRLHGSARVRAAELGVSSWQIDLDTVAGPHGAVARAQVIALRS